MTSNISMTSSGSDVFYLEQTSNEPSPERNNSPNLLNSTEIFQVCSARMPSVSSIAFPEPRIIPIDDNSNELTMPYGFGRQLPIVPPSLSDLNLPPNPLNILNTMAVVTQTHDNNDGYSLQSPEPSDPSPISTPPMNVSTFNSCETPHTTTDENTTCVLVLSPGWSIWFRRRTQTNTPIVQSITAATSSQDEEEVRDRDVLSKIRGSVAARLQSLRSDDPLSKGHPRSIEQELETWKTFETYIQTIKLTNLSI